MKTPLYSTHVQLGAKLVDFSGWQMPIQYEGIVAEHMAVRTNAGLFDVSHMGCILIDGKDAELFLNFLATSELSTMKTGSSKYTVFCNEEGWPIDDLIIYKRSDTSFFLIANAGNRDRVFEHLKNYEASFDVSVHWPSIAKGIIALQGPKAESILTLLFPKIQTLKAKHFVEDTYTTSPIFITRTGYSGEDGFELVVNEDVLESLWNELLNKGSGFGLKPAGLGARDTLRLEMGYALFGHELTDQISPLESVSAWTVKLQKTFLGKEGIETNSHRHAFGVVMQSGPIPRQGALVFKEEKKIGFVTSGGFSPLLKMPIALFLSDSILEEGNTIEIEIRGIRSKGIVTKLPFIK